MPIGADEGSMVEGGALATVEAEIALAGMKSYIRFDTHLSQAQPGSAAGNLDIGLCNFHGIDAFLDACAPVFTTRLQPGMIRVTELFE